METQGACSTYTSDDGVMRKVRASLGMLDLALNRDASIRAHVACAHVGEG